MLTDELEIEFKKLLLSIEKSKTVRTADIRSKKAREFYSFHSSPGFPIFEECKSRVFASYKIALEDMVK